MEPIDRRITAAHLMTLRGGPNPLESIAELLRVNQMPQILALRSLKDIETFIQTGDATVAAQLIHAATLRRQRGEPGLNMPNRPYASR